MREWADLAIPSLALATLTRTFSEQVSEAQKTCRGVAEVQPKRRLGSNLPWETRHRQELTAPWRALTPKCTHPATGNAPIPFTMVFSQQGVDELTSTLPVPEGMCRGFGSG